MISNCKGFNRVPPSNLFWYTGHSRHIIVWRKKGEYCAAQLLIKYDFTENSCKKLALTELHGQVHQLAMHMHEVSIVLAYVSGCVASCGSMLVI